MRRGERGGKRRKSREKEKEDGNGERGPSESDKYTLSNRLCSRIKSNTPPLPKSR